MYVFKKLANSDLDVEENVLYSRQTLTSSSLGLSTIQYRSGSLSGAYSSQKTVAGRHLY